MWKKRPVIILFVLVVFIYVAVDVNAADRITAKREVTRTNRPMRSRHDLVLTVGQDEGDLRGKDDKIIQAGIEYLSRVGGGTLIILPGVYNLLTLRYCNTYSIHKM